MAQRSHRSARLEKGLPGLAVSSLGSTGRSWWIACAAAAALLAPVTWVHAAPIAPKTAAVSQHPGGAATPAGAPRPVAAAGAGDAGAPPFSPFRFAAGNGPVRIKADSLSVDYKAKSVLFSGNVQATQSGATLTSSTLRVFYADKFSGIDRIVAEGDVRVRQGGRWATGQHAVLDEIHHTLEMTGQPVLHDGPNQVAGSRIIVYLDSQKSLVEGASAVIFPRTTDEQQVGGP